MKIFLTGFQRSGTTLLRHVVYNHPDARIMYHEICVLKKPCNFIKFDIDKENWGEKLPWFTNKTKFYKKSIFEYCKAWNDKFKSESKIIQIVRHPIDVLYSNLRTFKFTYKRTYNLMNRFFPITIPKIDSFPNCLSIKFEDLVINPFETLYKVYNFIGLDTSDDVINGVINNKRYRLKGIIKDRAFAYKTDPTEIPKFDYTKINNTLNKISGVKYKC